MGPRTRRGATGRQRTGRSGLGRSARADAQWPQQPLRPANGGNPYGPSAPNPYPNANPYPYGPQPGAPVPVARRRSCLWYVSPVFLAVAILRSAHRVATKLFVHESGDRFVDRTVDRVQVARTVLGVLATLALILVYGVEKDRWGNAAEEGLANAIVTPLVLICAGPLVILGFILYAPPHLRPHLRSRLGAPLKAVGWYVLTLVVLATTIYLAGGTSLKDHLHGRQALPFALMVMVAIFWGCPSSSWRPCTPHAAPSTPPMSTRCCRPWSPASWSACLPCST
ncbi:hypothetical protein [Streptomyces sp. HUAS TT20]|uniref:hypothetical protein n=1 Tax=Streptomyces sp. HUAS TT20 TaxID=3447509 RepID=UPI0021DB56AC|nr:hypothetical protein [Streptomyces sp. HUAS 15-9]UXY31969.1 hypothetical protein N8I87_39100 [Streptomyces sp. HUAS 15-9]